MMNDELKPLKPVARSDSTTRYGYSREDVSLNNTIPQPSGRKGWLDHWLFQGILIAIFIKVFGVLGGLAAMTSYYLLKRSMSTLIALPLSSVIGFICWLVAASIIKSNI